MSAMNIKNRFGSRLRGCRLKLGLSQDELADRAGLHRTYIGGVERGERNISLVNIFKLAHAMDLQLVELLAGIDDESTP